MLTPEEKAAQIMDALDDTNPPDGVKRIASAIREAVLTEREACAKIADDEDQEIAYSVTYANWVARQDACNEIAKAIRSRSQPPAVTRIEGGGPFGGDWIEITSNVVLTRDQIDKAMAENDHPPVTPPE